MGKYIRHVACEECGSSDANGVYEDGSTWCFSCHTYKGKEGENGSTLSPFQDDYSVILKINSNMKYYQKNQLTKFDLKIECIFMKF